MIDIHLVMTDHGEFGWSVESPQLPTVFGGGDDFEETLAIARELCEEAAWFPLPEFPEVHVQHPVVAANGLEYLLRTHRSPDLEVRQTRMLLTEALAEYLLLHDIDDATHAGQPPLNTGERLLVAAMPDDTLEWCEAQLDNDAAGRFVVLTDEGTDSIALVRDRYAGNDSYEKLSLNLGPTATLADALAVYNKYKAGHPEPSRRELVALV